MKSRILIAAIALAALPVAAQASVASSEALKVNHEALNVGQPTAHYSVDYRQLDTSGADSVAIAKARHYISVTQTKQTDLPSNTSDQPKVGHRVDW